MHHLVCPSRFPWRSPISWPFKQDFIGVPQEFWPTSNCKCTTKLPNDCSPMCAEMNPLRRNQQPYPLIYNRRSILEADTRPSEEYTWTDLFLCRELVKSSCKFCGSVPSAHCFAHSCAVWYNTHEDNLQDLEWSYLMWVHWKETLSHK